MTPRQKKARGGVRALLVVLILGLLGIVAFGVYQQVAGGNGKPAAGCIPSTQILRQLQQEKPGGENFKAPWDKNEIATIKAQEIAWVQTHLDDACVRSMAAHVHVKPADLPAWLQKATLKRVGKTGLAWFYHGKRVFDLNGSVYSPPKAAASAKCATTVHYYALSNHNFGPPLKGSTPKARLHNLQSRYCVDPLLTADNARAMKLHGYAGLSDTQVRAAAQRLVAHRADWRKLVKALDAKENKDFRSDVLLSGEYRTGYMVRQHSGMPLLGTTQLSSTHRSLRFQVGSTTVYLQEPCGGQPRVQVPVKTVAARSPSPPTVVTVVYHQPPPSGCTGTKCAPHHQPPPKCTTKCGHQPPPCKSHCGPPPPCKSHCGPPPCKGSKCGPPPPCKTNCGPPPCKTHCGPPPCKTNCGPPPCKSHCGPPPPCSTCTSKQPPPVQDPGSPSTANDGPTPGAPSQAPAPNPVATTSGSGTTAQAPAPAPDNGPGKTAGYAGSGTGTGGTTPGGSTSDSGGTTANGGSSATSNPTTGDTGTYSGSPTGPPS